MTDEDIKFIIVSQEIVEAVKQIKKILDDKGFPLCVELGILEDLKHGVMHMGHKEL